LSNFSGAILNQRVFPRIKVSDNDLRGALEDVVSEKDLLGSLPILEDIMTANMVILQSKLDKF